MFFRRICGRVVKLDRLTGDELPVPFATVHVEDTDCSFLGFFPVENPWAWFFPIFCHREDIGTTTTDACGNFCVWVPRFEIDWILRFRRERICFPDIFVKPNIGNIIRFVEDPQRPPHGPWPDPPPFLSNMTPAARQTVAHLVGADAGDRIIAAEKSGTIGSNATQRERLLARQAFPQTLPPPVPSEFHQVVSHISGTKDKAEHAKAVQNTLAARLNIEPAALKHLDLTRFVGPFFRCFEIFVPEWIPILDVPDITFRVTQDVNGDGTQEVIYSEGFFDVRWNAGAIPDVVLLASPIAVASRVCNAPEVPCGDEPAILFAGLMPLENPPGPADPYVDLTGGYARRPNRPTASGGFPWETGALPRALSLAPYCNELQLYGCNRLENAAFYRLRYSFNGGPTVPFVGLTWPVHRLVGTTLQTHWPVSDAQGWYPVLPFSNNPSDNWFPDVLLDWITNESPDGLYTITLEIGDAAKNVITTSPSVGIRVDNSSPSVLFTALGWRFSDVGGAFTPLSLDCPVIARGAIPRDIDIQVSYSASATHFRSVELSASGCGLSGTIARISSLDTVRHWSTDPVADNSVSQTAVFQILQSSAAGSYSFGLSAVTRAFNPSGGDGGDVRDWNYDPVYRASYPQLSVAVVNA